MRTTQSRSAVAILGAGDQHEVSPNPKFVLWHEDVDQFLRRIPASPTFDLVVTSPPYNLGKDFESKRQIGDYIDWQSAVITKVAKLLKPESSLCWQVGNYVEDGAIIPLDIELAPAFKSSGLLLRNRIIWKFGHGLHTKRRFSGRYEVVLWYTNGDAYTFNLDPIRVPSKYPSKKHYKGPKAGQLSGNPLGKNPEDVWEIPNVKSNHVEKTSHPSQFPVALVERLILALTDPGDLVFDPFAGVATTGVAAAMHRRRFWGCDISREYLEIGKHRISDALEGTAKYRPVNKPIYDPRTSNLSAIPREFEENYRLAAEP